MEQAEQATGVQFCVYLGPTGEDPRAHAETMFQQAGLQTRPAVLLLVSPEQHRVEILTSPEVQDRVTDQTCELAVAEMTTHFARSDVVGGLVAGLEQLQVAAGPAVGTPTANTFPDVIEP